MSNAEEHPNAEPDPGPLHHAIPPNLQTRSEERLNSLTHGAGVVLSVAGLVALVVAASQAGDVWQIVASSIFGATMVLLYLASTIYHALPAGQAKRLFRNLDHIGIYLLIAGTYTVISLTALRDTIGWGLFGVEWGLAATGITLKSIYGPRYNLLSTIGYVVMGWLVIFVLGDLVEGVSTETLTLLFAGGVFYTLGVPFFLLDQKRRYFHAIWHLFVMAGTACHFLMAYLYLVG